MFSILCLESYYISNNKAISQPSFSNLLTIKVEMILNENAEKQHLDGVFEIFLFFGIPMRGYLFMWEHEFFFAL